MTRLHRTTIFAATLAAPLCAEEIKITVWAGGSGDVDTYHMDAIAMAADILEREAAIRGETLNITVDGKRDFASWDDFKQAVTLGAEAGTAPAIVVTSHLDIAPLSQAGYIVRVEDSLGLDAWPLSNVYPDLMEIASFGDTLQDPATGKLVLDKAAMTAFYQFFDDDDDDAVAAGVTRKTHIGTDWDQWYAEVATGKALFWHGGTWHYANYTGKQSNTDFFGTIGFSLIPAGGEGGKPNTITHPLVYLVTKQADERVQEISAQLIAIATEPRLNSLHAIKSAHLAVAEAQAGIDLHSGDRWASEATAALLPHANSQPNHVKYGAYSEAMFKGLEAVWTGVQTPDQAVTELEAALTAALGDELIVR